MSRPTDAPVLHVGGRELALPPSGRLIIGRDPRADVVVDDDRVSWRHAEVTCEQGATVIRDLDSRNGTWIDGVRLGAVAQRLGSESTVTVGGTRLRYRGPGAQTTPRSAGREIPIDGPLVVGRAPNCDITLDEPNVSWRHARIDPGSPPRVFDLG